MSIAIEKKGRYPTVKELKIALDRVRDLTGNDNLPIVGGSVFDDTAIDRITILKKDNTEWNSRTNDGQAFGLFLG